jgi:hypothetical protein
MLRGEQKAPVCTDGSVVKPGRKIEAVDSDGVDQLDNRSKETGEGGMVTGVVTVESAAVGKVERGIGTEDDRVVLDGEDW